MSYSTYVTSSATTTTGTSNSWYTYQLSPYNYGFKPVETKGFSETIGVWYLPSRLRRYKHSKCDIALLNSIFVSPITIAKFISFWENPSLHHASLMKDRWGKEYTEILRWAVSKAYANQEIIDV
jgi:hypothetical protein